jgi:hypothetical protein
VFNALADHLQRFFCSALGSHEPKAFFIFGDVLFATHSAQNNNSHNKIDSKKHMTRNHVDGFISLIC